MAESDILAAELKNVRQELATIRKLLSQVLNKVIDAEAEIPEKIRRFMNYMHDLHDIKYMYEELGHVVPAHHLREMERCDDRFRQLMVEQNAEGGSFNKIRREMASDPLNRWDHTRLLAKPKETSDETGTSDAQRDRIDEGRADVPGGESGSGG